ncbi:hypothetical protein BDQ17DRAFT_352993 [Cyathus striatus]|nr:hypothetical protein BDQ17DRAFT_352993 [Cyathus striatus]
MTLASGHTWISYIPYDRMIIPYTNGTCPEVDGDAGVPVVSNYSNPLSSTAFFLCMVLVFYGFALWDRWMQLKMRELDKIQAQNAGSYGSTNSSKPTYPVVRRLACLRLTAFVYPSHPHVIYDWL